MDKKAISEIRKLIKPDRCIDRICGCYVSEEGEVIRRIQTPVFSIEDASFEKYCEILRSSLSGKLGRNLFNLEFPLAEESEGGRQQALYRMLQSGLDRKTDLSGFYEKVVEHFKCDSKYLILLAHGAYDIPAKGTDNMEMEDASEYVYSFIICCICPVVLAKEGLCYDEKAGTFLDRRMDWAAQKPVSGFLFPAFNDRQPDIHSLLYYCKKEDARHEEFSSEVLGCGLPMPESDQKELFRSMVEQTLGRDCNFENVKNLNNAVGEFIRQNRDGGEPVQIEKTAMRRLLSENGADQSVLSDFDTAYEEAVGDGPMMAENLIDTSRLEVRSPAIKLEVRSDMSDMLKTRVVDGVEYLLIPVTDEIEVNGIRILQTERKEG